MIRLTLIFSFLILFFILSIPIYLVEWILKKYNKRACDRSCKWFVRTAFKVCLFFAGTKIESSGVENIPEDTPILFVGNHNGFFDILVAYTVIPTPFGFVSKKEVRKVPFLNLWMHFINCLWMDRSDMKKSLKTILEGVERMKNGTSFFIFPEGTRSQDGKLLPFKEGALKMAEKAHCPIVPVAMTGTADAFENQFPRVKKAHVTIQIGKPIYIDQLEKEQKKFLGAYTQKIIQDMLDENLPR